VKLYTGKGDDGTTGLLYGGRVLKTDPAIEATGAVDEAQCAIGLARAECDRGSELDGLLVRVEHDLYVLMAELTTAQENRHKLQPDTTLVTKEMVQWVESACDLVGERFAMPSEFVIPGQNRMAGLLDVARTVVRRAERLALRATPEGSAIVPYLNRLSSLMWVLARWQEGDDALPSRSMD
jgi:cob(I)alamin adenosyltransferase